VLNVFFKLKKPNNDSGCNAGPITIETQTEILKKLKGKRWRKIFEK
jgi:hypothetical protein